MARTFQYHNTAFGIYPESEIVTPVEDERVHRQLVVYHSMGSSLTLFVGDSDEEIVSGADRLIAGLTRLRDAAAARIAAAQPEAVA